jgi:hypothetical protein
MAELKRKEENLSTADLAGRNQSQPNVRPEAERRPDKPKLVPARPSEGAPPSDVKQRDNLDPKLRDNVAAQGTPSAEPTPLFSEVDVTELRARWSTVQAGFVDEPRKAVEEADNLVASVMKRLAEGFANERANLEKQWDRGDSVSTEDLRVALQRYRSFFDRLLKA